MPGEIVRCIVPARNKTMGHSLVETFAEIGGPVLSPDKGIFRACLCAHPLSQQLGALPTAALDHSPSFQERSHHPAARGVMYMDQL